MFLLTALAALFSVVPTTITLITTIATAILFPLVAAIVLGILELTTNIVVSSESVALLIFSPPILLFPFKLVRAVGNPVLQAALVVFAPALFPFQALLVSGAAILSFVFEFKALYTFLATAATFGLFAGTILHLTTYFLSPLLGLNSAPAPAQVAPRAVPRAVEPEPVLRPHVTHPVPRAPRKATLGRHSPALKKHIPDGPNGNARPRRVRFTFDEGSPDGVLA